MTVLMSAPHGMSDTRPVVRDRKGTSMLLHEALARSRQQEAEEAARRYRLVRSVSAANRQARRTLLGAVLHRVTRSRAAAARRAAYARVVH